MSKRDLLTFEPQWNRYAVAAIHTNLESHQMVWELNRRISFSFWRLPDDIRIYNQKSDLTFTAFCTRNPEEDLCWLLSNAGDQGYLITASPRPDYLIIADGNNCHETVQSMIEAANQIQQVALAYPLHENNIEKLHWIPYLNYELYTNHTS